MLMVQTMMLFGLTLIGIINMKKWLIFKTKPGVTLIELLLYIAIFSLIISTVVGVALSALGSRARNNAVIEVDYQGARAISMMTSTIRSSQGINSPALGVSSGSLSLLSNQVASNPVVYSAISQSGVSRLIYTEGNNPSISLTNNKVSVVDMSFNNSTALDGKQSIQVTLTLRYNNVGNRPELNYQKTFYGAGTLR